MNPLIQAIQNNNVNQLKLLLDMGHDPDGDVYSDFSIDESQTPLSYAYEERNIECAETLLKSGADPDDIFDQVVIECDIDWAKLVLKHGADPDQHIEPNRDEVFYYRLNENVQYPLNYFAEKNISALIELFIEFGADVNLKDDFGCTPIFYAIRGRALLALDTLISHGVNIHAVDNDGRTPIHHVAKSRFDEAIMVLVSNGANVNQQDIYGKTALFYSVENDAFEVTQELLWSQDIDITIRDNSGRTAIFSLAETYTDNTLEMVKLLIRHGLSIDVEDKTGRSLISHLILANKSNTVKYLLQRGARIKPDERIDNIPLIHYTIAKNSFEEAAILELLNQDINLDEKDIHGDTPLLIALKNNRIEIAKAIIKKGVNINVSNNSGEQALHYAIRSARVDLFHMIYKEPRLDYSLSDSELAIMIKISIQSASFELLHLLLTRNPDSIKELQSPLLNEVVMKKCNALAKYLIESGCCVNTPNENNVTPLFFAAKNNLREIAGLLIAYGADINYCNDLNITPLIEAVKNNSTEVAKLLLEKGANFQVVDWEGFTALDYAKQRNNKELIAQMGKTQ